MKRISIIILLGTVTIALLATGAAAQQWKGTLALGGVFLDETGDRSTMVETYNVFDGFSVTQLQLTGNLNPQHTFSLNLREVNLDSRKGEFVYRMPGKLRINARYDQWRQLFDSDASITSNRQNWRAGLNWTVIPNAIIRANYNHQKKSGSRIGYPGGTESVLGNGYDYVLQTGLIEGDFRQSTVGMALTYQFSDFNDSDTFAQDRFGQVFSARLYGSAYFWPDKLTHMLRASWGQQETSDLGLDMNTLMFEYTGVLRPHERFQFKYNFFARTIDDGGTGFDTDNFRNNFDLTYFSQYGRVYGGYSYEVNDNNLLLTQYNTFVVGLSGNYEKKLRGQIEYGSRSKDDQDQRTLLQDIESDRLKATLRYQVIDDLHLGGKISYRQRDFTTIGVKAEGVFYNVYGSYEYPDWGSLLGDYTYSDDDYVDLAAGFKVASHITTGRLQLDRIKDLRIITGITFLSIGKDLDIEKSVFFIEGKYIFVDDYFVEVKYNAYNYDDFVVLNRYYSANVVWLNVGYNLN